MKPTNIGDWFSINSKKIASCLLFLLVTWISGCNQLQSTGGYMTASPPTGSKASPVVKVSPTTESQPTPFPHGYRLPAWSQLELPPGCSFGFLSPDLKWVLLRGCPSTSGGSTDLIARVTDQGELQDSKQLKDWFIQWDYESGVMGFTPNSSQVIVRRNETFWLVNLPDLTKQPYLPGTLGVSGINELGSERWSPDGRLYLDIGPQGPGEIVIVFPNDGTKETILGDAKRHGAQFTWSVDGKEVAYIEGDFQGVMKAQMMNLQSKQSRTLLESQTPLSGASCSPDGKWVAVREQKIDSAETILWLIEPRTGLKDHLAYNLSGGADVFNGWQDMVWSPDGTKLALRGSNTETDDGFVVIEIPTGKIVFRGNESAVRSPLAWSADSTSLLVLDYRLRDGSTPSNYILRWMSIQP